VDRAAPSEAALLSKEELIGLRQHLDVLKLGSMTIREDGRDVTQHEIDKLESVLRSSDAPVKPKGPRKLGGSS
jgi:hypothetical protein